MEYTKELHPKYLLKMLEQDKPCAARSCPYYLFDQARPSQSCFCLDCEKICWEFLGLTARQSCPCQGLGHVRAIKLTWLRLEELGLLD